MDFSMWSLIGRLQDERKKRKEKSKSPLLREGFDDSIDTAGGLFIFIIVLIVVVLLVSFVWSIYCLIKYWNKIPDWAKAVGIMGILMGFPILTIIVVYASKTK